MPDTYSYSLEANWTGARTGLLTADDLPPLRVAPPPEFSGPGGMWSPEHLLVAASASCLMATFLAIAEISRLPVHSFRLEAKGRLEKVAGEGLQFTEIVLSPEVGVAPENIERGKRLMEKAEKSCLISRSLRTAIRVEPRWIEALEGVPR
jgi:peroxiredoxin-like protein